MSSEQQDLLAHMVELSLARINAAIEYYKPKLVVGLFSGGHDSLSANLIASRTDGFDGCLHVNTGIGIEATREFVRKTCQRQSWHLWEYKAIENTKADGTPDPMDYDAIVRRYGFPGPDAHRYMYIKLKQRCIDRFLRDMRACPESPVLFISGARTEESTRRMGNTKTEPSNYGRSVWLNAIHDWTKTDTNALIDGLKVERNLVVDLIHKSGECLCGAYAQRGELEELNQWDITRPQYKRIVALQNEVAKNFPWKWEEAPPTWWNEKNDGQTFLLDYDEPEAWEQPLCHRCNQVSNVRLLK